MAMYETAFKLEEVKSFLAADGGVTLVSDRGERPHLGEAFPSVSK
jgi:hypothetical protein